MTTAAPLTPAEQNQLLGEATTVLLGAAPRGWHRILLDYMVIGRKVNVGAAARMDSGTTERFAPPRELAPILSNLRRGMYTENVGTWYSFRLAVDPPDIYSVKYNWNDEPPFPSAPDPTNFALEQERLPRSEENMPEWFRRGLDGSQRSGE